MEPISSMMPGVTHPLSIAADVKEPSNVQRSGDKIQGRPITPAMDEYIPEEKQEPTGRYWLDRDEEGRTKVYFDSPERAADAPEKQDVLPDADNPTQGRGTDGPEKKVSDKKAESCTGSTDKVDREIEKLKKKQEELERQINSETDDAKIKELERKLAQVESELRQKDNDAYRRRH